MSAATAILRRSPYDREAPADPPALVQMGRPARSCWVPSRFNAREVDDQGRLLLWNSFTSSLTAFGPGQREGVEALLKREGFTGKLEGLAAYLHERGYIVEADSDEHRRFQLAFGEQHYRTDLLQLILLPSEDCNFRCVYCYEDFARGTMQPWVRDSVKNLVRKRMDQLRELNISWFGGEPLYGWTAMEELAPFFADICREKGIRYFSHMTTNGYLLTPDVADKLLAWQIRDFQITIDGPPEQHDSKRVGRDGSGTWDTIMENLRAMRSRDEGFHVKIRVNYDRENYPTLDELFQILQHEFAGDDRFTVGFHAVGKWGGKNDAELETCGVDESRRIKDELRRAAKGKGLKILGRGLRAVRRGGNVCYAARPYNLIVGADGKLMKCTVILDAKEHNVVGSITPEGDLVLNEDRMALWTQPGFENDDVCRKCYYVPVCQGISCPMIRIDYDRRPCPDTKRGIRRELILSTELDDGGGRPASLAGAAR
jgi:uncharacterized protein